MVKICFVDDGLIKYYFNYNVSQSFHSMLSCQWQSNYFRMQQYWRLVNYLWKKLTIFSPFSQNNIWNYRFFEYYSIFKPHCSGLVCSMSNQCIILWQCNIRWSVGDNWQLWLLIDTGCQLKCSVQSIILIETPSIGNQ